MRRQAFIVVIAVVLLRLPFLNTAAQWDDVNYIAAARYALTDPAHPSHMEFVFQGELVSMRGHPHPPGMAWILAGLMLVLGPFREAPYHAAFLGFSIVAALSMLGLARRFAPRSALEATLLFLVVPASLVSGTSFESDMPLLAFWMLATALFVEGAERRDARWIAAAGVAMAGASMVAYTAFLIAPICLVYLAQRRCGWRPAWLILATPFAVIGGYQLYERLTSGSLPANELMGHMRTHGLQTLGMKTRNAIALTADLGLVVSPLAWIGLGRRARAWQWAAAGAGALALGIVLWRFDLLLLIPFAFGLLVLFWTAKNTQKSAHLWLQTWVLTYFFAALAVFFAGAARYLLPLAAPLVLLAARALEDRRAWLRLAIAANLALGLSFAWVNAEHWDQSREFAREAMTRAMGRRVWISAEWGVRHYAEAAGAKPLVRGTVLAPGDMLITSGLSGDVPFGAGGNRMEERMRADVKPWLPLRIAGIAADASYATIGFGIKPFDIAAGPVDRLALLEAVEVEPTLSWLPMNAPEAKWQIVSGAYGLEDGQWRWAAAQSVYRLKSPQGRAPLVARVYIPEAAPGRLITLAVDGKNVAARTVPGAGTYEIEAAPLEYSGASVMLALAIDRDFQPQGDPRRLGLIVSAVGFPPQQGGSVERGGGNR